MTLEYETAALNFLSGKGFMLERFNVIKYADFSPLYGFISIIVYYFFGHHQILLLIINSFFTSLSCIYIFFIGRMISYEVGFVASTLVGFHPGLLYYDLFYLHPLSLDTLLFMLILYFSIQIYKGEFSFYNLSMLGILFGLQMHERGTIVLYIFIFSLLLLVKLKKNFMKFCIVPCFFIIVVAPWLIRNYSLYKQMTPMLTVTGELLWRGNNSLATGTSWAENGMDMFSAAPESFQQEIFKLDEIGQKKRFEQEAIKFIVNNPLKFLQLSLKKVYYFWWFSPYTGKMYSSYLLNIYKVYYIFILSFFFVGVFFLLRNRVEIIFIKMFILMCLTVSFMQSIFYVQAKHRWALEPLVLIFSTVGLLALKNRFNYPKSVKPELSLIK